MDWRFALGFGAVMLLTLMAALDATSISVALPAMAKDAHGTALEAFWSGTSFLLASAVFQPSIGSFSSIFGRKPMLYLSMTLFAVGAILAGIAKNFTLILTGRTIQGVGGGGIIVIGEILITDLVPLADRGKYMSIQSAMWSLGTILGPIMGGGFAANVSWRWIFYINLPLILIAAPLIFSLRLNFPVSSIMAKLQRVDWFGSVLFVASATSFIIPITWGGVMYDWTSWHTTVPLIAGVFGLIIFIMYEEKWAPNPLIHSIVFKNRTAALVYLQNFLHGVILWCMLYYMPLYFEAVKGYSPIISGVALFPQCFTLAPSAGIAGFAIALTGRYRWGVWAGWALSTAGVPLFTLFHRDTPIYQWVLLGLVGGIGFGFLFPSLALALQAATHPSEQAYAMTMFSFLRVFGETVGVAVGGVIFQNRIQSRLLEYPAFAARATDLSKDVVSLVGLIKSMPAGQEKTDLQDAFVYGLRYVWIVMTVLAGIALVSSFFVEGLSLNQELATDQGLIHTGGVHDEDILVGRELDTRSGQSTKTGTTHGGWSELEELPERGRASI